MRVTDKGQVTIPRAVRRESGLLPGVEVDVRLRGSEVIITARDAAKGESKREAEIRDHLQQTRGAASHSGWSADDVMRLTRGDD